MRGKYYRDQLQASVTLGIFISLDVNWCEIEDFLSFRATSRPNVRYAAGKRRHVSLEKSVGL